MYVLLDLIVIFNDGNYQHMPIDFYFRCAEHHAHECVIDFVKLTEYVYRNNFWI